MTVERAAVGSSASVGSIVPVALVMPLRNEARALGDFFDAYRAFTVRAREVIFVDTGSTDGTVAMVEAWCLENATPEAGARLVSCPGGLPGGGRNAGVRAAIAPWIAFLDGGIRPAPDWLERLYDCVAGSGRPYALGSCRFDSSRPVGLAVCALTNGAGRVRPVLPSSIFAREVFGMAGWFDPALRAGEDLLWLERVRSVCGTAPSCEQARTFYERYPESLGAVWSKWMRYEFSVTGTRIGRRKRVVLGIAAAGVLASLLVGSSLTIALIIAYLVSRGVLDPVRRSRRFDWWRRAPGAAVVAPVVALAIDAGSLAGALRRTLRAARALPEERGG